LLVRKAFEDKREHFAFSLRFILAIETNDASVQEFSSRIVERSTSHSERCTTARTQKSDTRWPRPLNSQLHASDARHVYSKAPFALVSLSLLVNNSRTLGGAQNKRTFKTHGRQAKRPPNPTDLVARSG
jgi:hypothetical protein